MVVPPATPAATYSHPAPHPLPRSRAVGSRSGRGLSVSPAAAWLAAGAIYLAISRLHQYITPLGRAQAPMLLSVAALVMLLGSMHRWRPGDLGKQFIPRGIGYIAIIALLGIPFAIYPGASFATINESFSRSVLLAVMGWAVARTPDGLRFMAKVVAAGGLTAVVLAIVQGRVDDAGRLAGAGTYDPNDLALIAVITLPLLVWWIMDRANRGRFLLLPFVPLIFWVIYRTDSRGGFLAVAAVIVGLTVLGFSGASPKLRKLAIAAVLAAVVAIPLLPGEYLSRLQTITSSDDYNRNSDSGRIMVWRRGIGYALDNPLLGVGMGGFNAAEGHSATAKQRAAEGRGFKWSTAHSAYVLVLAELGFVGGGIFIYLIVRTILALGLLARRRQGLSPGASDLLAPLLAISMVGYAVGATFLSFVYYDTVYILLALASATLMQAQAGHVLGLSAGSDSRAGGRGEQLGSIRTPARA